MTKAELKRRICEMDFAIHELILFLDSHPTSRKAMKIMEEYREKRKELIRFYEDKFGKYIVTHEDVPTGDCWKWLEGPWPWEINFMED